MNPRHLSKTNEHFTPTEIVEAARSVMGNIDLDPATTKHANDLIVKADNIFTQEDNGFAQEWHGKVFLNPPGGKCDMNGISITRNKQTKKWECDNICEHFHTGVASSQKKWWFKLAKEYEQERVQEAIFVGFSIEILQVTQTNPAGKIPLDFSFCVPKKRISYLKQEDDNNTNLIIGKSPPHSSVLIYLGPNLSKFRQFFEPIGVVRLY